MREAGPTAQLCGDNDLERENVTIASMHWDRNAEEELATNRETLCSCCLNFDGFIHHMRVILGHSGGTNDDFSLLDNVQIPYMWSEYISHAGSSSLRMHSVSNQD